MNRARLAAGAAAAALVLTLVPGATQAQTPLFFPRTQQLDTTSYTLRIAGDNRYATAAALGRVSAIDQNTTTGYPFNEADATTDTKAYGFGACPRTVGVAAGDTVADALAAAPLKDLANVSFEGTSVDTTNAVMLLTVSGRQGGKDLDADTLGYLQDLKDACGAYDGVVFGSTAAVPTPAFDALSSLAANVVRVTGTDRFDTARKIATAVGAAAGAANVDLFTAANTKTTLTNTVFLADGQTGADALAVGPFAAQKNVPVLLASGGTLPVATRNGLLALHPANIIVLGGTGVISDDVVKEATTAAGGTAKATRIGGADRYDTSVKVAQQLFNLYPVEPPQIPGLGEASADYTNVMMGVARSEGSGINHVGYPDALASAWFLDTASDQGANPRRLAPPIEQNADTTGTDGARSNVAIGGAKGTHRAALLLTSKKALPGQVATHITGMFPDPTRTATDPENTSSGGFGFVFGGVGAVEQAAVLTLAQGLSGGSYVEANRTDLASRFNVGRVFYTAMEYAGYTSPEGGGVDAQGAVGAGDKICALRDAMAGAQHLAVYQVTSFSSSGQVDYQDGTGWPAFTSRFQCFPADNVSSDRARVLAIGPTGRDTPAKALDWSSDELLLQTPAPVNDDRADTISGSGATTEQYVPGGQGTAKATWAGTMPVRHKGTLFNNATFTLEINFTRIDPGNNQVPMVDPDDDRLIFIGTLIVRSPSALLFTANLEGEATGQTLPFKLAGMYTVGGGGAGGFRATITGETFALGDMVLDGIAALPTTTTP